VFLSISRAACALREQTTAEYAAISAKNFVFTERERIQYIVLTSKYFFSQQGNSNFPHPCLLNVSFPRHCVLNARVHTHTRHRTRTHTYHTTSLGPAWVSQAGVNRV
jgi:hypothetical protein